VIARARLVIGRGERTSLQLCALSFSLAIDRRVLPRALKRGLRARARCSPSCTVSLTLSIPASVARRYGLTKRRSGRVVLARGAHKKAFSGRKTFTVRFTAPARRRLAGARRLRLRMSAVARGSGDKSRVTRTLVLRR
ncbi:MAG: hypothetical protein ACRDLS_13510, partial [Solirubrobacteraceae bacterium]